MIKVVGITGLMASGKTYVSNIFSSFGAYILNTDIIAKKVQLSQPELKSKLIKKFSKNYYTETGLINVEYVRNLVFGDTKESQKNLKWITKTVGKYVLEYIELYIQQLKTQNQQGYILIESAILFETGLNEICDYTICVKSTSPKRAAMMRDNITEEEWENRMKTQLPDGQKHYDYIIGNDYSINVNNEVKKVHDEIMKIIL